ncbi:MAG TPA: adenosylcobinamide-GDP ribazoletransferase [Acidimicrobiales bacterium]|nr:adenosylcobinamide-GDP ribazoletransferase [Acidimicrobiales bacterium]
MRRALGFLTPFGRAAVPSVATLDWFPVAGAAIGLAVGVLWWLAGRAWPPVVAAGVALACDAALTGYLHLDGLADSADGLLPPMARPRRLEVMADPAVGAFGAVTLVVVLVLRFGAFASTAAAPLVLGALWCGSRTGMAVVARCGPYARPGGLASAFIGPGEQGGSTGRDGISNAVVPGLIGVALAVGLAVAGRGTHGLAAVGGEAVGFALVIAFAHRRIGGFTGDVLGAAGVVGETVGLLVLAAKW